MDFNLGVILENALYLLALLNPASKVMFLSAYDPPLRGKDVLELAWKSSLAALLILLFLAWAGEVVLSGVFRVELYSLRISGGVVLFYIGWNAIQEGRFGRKQDLQTHDFTEISLVPLAAPLIAGPGTIAAAITGTAESGWAATAIALFLAISANFMVMLFSNPINRFLVRTHFLGPLIRVTGLVIATVAVQMVITGLRECRL